VPAGAVDDGEGNSVKARPGVLTLCLVLLAAFGSLTACSGGDDETTTLRVLASSELADMEPLLDGLRRDTGVRLEMDYRATNDASDTLAGGRHSYDLAWLSSDRYFRLKLKESAKSGASAGAAAPVQRTAVMRSPVVVGLTPDVAKRLRDGTADGRLSWADIADGAATGTVRFGMADPRHTNSGLSALVGVATAAAGTGSALRRGDVSCDRLRGFRSGQTLTADTSRELIDAFVDQPGKANTLITYESELLALNNGDRLKERLEVVYPQDGMVLSDYPLLLLDPSRRDAYDRVVDWLTDDDQQQDIMQRTLRRPVSATVRRDERLRASVGNALYFPDELAIVERLIADYGDPARRIADQVIFLLDFSGSMRGSRMVSLREAFAGLSGADSSSTGKFARFYQGERLTVIRFGGRPLGARTVTVEDPEDLNELQAFVARGGYDDSTAVWTALDHGYGTASAAVAENPERAVSIVLMTDGENNAGIGYDEFVRRYEARAPEARAVHTYPVQFGDADARELRRAAATTGGRMVDANESSLSEAFKEIRGCR
jgi:Ca-activated chloride channel family protein